MVGVRVAAASVGGVGADQLYDGGYMRIKYAVTQHGSQQWADPSFGVFKLPIHHIDVNQENREHRLSLLRLIIPGIRKTGTLRGPL